MARNQPLPSLQSLVGKSPAQGAAKTATLPTLSDLVGGKGQKFKEAPAKKGGGGFFGSLKSGAHWVAQKSELAARDIKQIPAGLVQIGTLEGKALSHDVGQAIHHPLRTQSLHSFVHGQNNPASQKLGQFEAASGRSAVTSFKHPARDPFQTFVNASAVLGGGAGAIARIGEVGRTGEVGALLRRAPVRPRTPIVDETPALHASRNAAVRAGQGAYDKTLRKAVATNPEGRLAAHATKRVGGAISETNRYQQRMRAVPAQQLAAAAKRLGRHQRVEQAALELTSVNTAPDIASAYHLAQAEKGVNPVLNRAVSKLYGKVHERGLLEKNKQGDMIVNFAEHPKLAQADLKLADVQGRGDAILKRYGIRSADELQARVNAPGRIREGATYEKPTPGKLGVPSARLIKMRSRVERLQTLHDRSVEKAGTAAAAGAGKAEAAVGTYIVGPGRVAAAPGAMRAERLGSALSVAKDELQRAEAAAARRVKPTGILGGQTARPGRGFVSYATSEPKAPTSSVASAASPVVGIPKEPITKQAFTGKGIEQGLIPKDVTGQAVRHFQQIQRFVNTSEHRNLAIKTGAATRQTSRDVLVKVPGAEQAKIPAAINELLGKGKVTADDAAGIQAALNAYQEEMIPGLRDKFATDKQAGIGTPAPKGHVWVDRNVLGDLGRPGPEPRGPVTRFADNVNSAVTAATVYFKIGHVGTRVLTNATTNLVQGSLDPISLGRSVKLFHQLSEQDQMRALAAGGQHGFQAMPHEGVGRVAKIAGGGARWWAKHADAPFRFNSFAYEARKAGFDTPAKFRDLLDKLENPHEHNMNAAQAAKVDWVAKRANRAGIAYDRLNETERRFLTRGIWFYPWVKGASMFAGHTLIEHPLKSAIGANLAVKARERQAKELGQLPSYESGLFKLAGGARPLVTDFSTFQPYATPANVIDAAARPSQLSGFLNPAYTAGTNLIFGLNQFGQKSKSPVTDALASLTAPTPEAQLVSAYLKRKQNQRNRMFHTTPGSVIERALVGPAMPRRINLQAAHKSAGREISGR